MSDCPSQARDIIASFARESVPAGTVIVEENTPGDKFYIIEKGKVEMFARKQNFRKVRNYTELTP